MPIYQPTDPTISAMNGIHVYQYFMSNCAQRVCLALEEKGLEWTPHAVNLFTQENTTEAYFRINPKGLVPAVVHDGKVITESMDILRYLEEHFPEPALYPPDPDERKQVDDWMNLATERHVSDIKTYMYSLALGSSKKPEGMKAYAEKQVDPELVAFHQETMTGFSQSKILAAERAIFAFFDDLEHELGQHRWLVGDEFTYADIAWFVQYFHDDAQWVGELRALPCRSAMGGGNYAPPIVRKWCPAYSALVRTNHVPRTARQILGAAPRSSTETTTRRGLSANARRTRER